MVTGKRTCFISGNKWLTLMVESVKREWVGRDERQKRQNEEAEKMKKKGG